MLITKIRSLFFCGLPCVLAALCLIAWVGLMPRSTLAAPDAPQTDVIRISQVYGGGGNSGALFTHDLIELYNSGGLARNLNGWSVQYTSATGTSWQVTPLGDVTIPAHGYLLIRQAQGNGGSTPLPPFDVTGTIAMNATSGKIALVNSTTALSVSCPTGLVVILLDMVRPIVMRVLARQLVRVIPPQ